MKLIFYSAEKSDFSSGLLDQLPAMLPREDVIVCRGAEQTSQGLAKTGL